METKILDLFLFNNVLKFNEIQKLLNARSNKIAYHLKNLVKKGILIKTGQKYSLSETSEYLIPYLSDKKALLPVLLVYLGNKNKSFLYKRDKRPFKNKLSLPGGRILMGESIQEATKRIMKKKFNVDTRFKKVNSVSLEHVKKANKIIHSFLLIFATAETKQKIPLININSNKKDMISSDYHLIKRDADKTLNLNTIFSKT